MVTFKIESAYEFSYGDLIKKYAILKDFGVRYTEDGGAVIFIDSLGNLMYLLDKLQEVNKKANAIVVFKDKLIIYDGYIE